MRLFIYKALECAKKNPLLFSTLLKYWAQIYKSRPTRIQVLCQTAVDSQD